MPKLSRWFVKSALVCLVLGCLSAGLAMPDDALALPGWVAAFRPLSWHLLAFGWATQLIFGVAFWMFPHASKEQPRGNERLGWTAWILLNVGIGLRAIGEPAATLSPGVTAGLMLAVSAVAQVVAIGIFVYFTWPRVKALGR